MINNTSNFIRMINQVIKDNKEYFSTLERLKLKDIQQVRIKILHDLQIDYKESYELSEIFQNHIKNFILNRKEDFSMNMNILKNISIQIEIDYLLKFFSKDNTRLYYSISHALIYYGIYKDSKIVPFQNDEFWNALIKKLYLLNLMNHNQYITCCDDNYPTHPDFNQLPRLVEARKNIKEKLKEEIDIIDTVVIFRKGQEERIVKKIEKKLSQLNLFYFLEFIFNRYEHDKKNPDTMTTPFKYIINILIKNLASSKHKIYDDKKVMNNIGLLTSFISLYQLKENKFEIMSITEHSLVEHLKKQVLYTNFYPLYSLKTDTLIAYIEGIIKPSIEEKLFFNKFGFTIENLINFFNLLDNQRNDVITFKKDNVDNNGLKILELFSINAKDVNQNYTTISNLSNSRNIFTMNPIIKYKNEFYIIGFQYFKMNFYNTLVEKIRKILDKDINSKIGTNVDILVENIFTKMKDKHGYEIFSGSYRPPKRENPESDLILKLKKDIIFIENKNKYLTNDSFNGADSNILKDLVLSFAFSQKQLLKHERNLKINKIIKFIKDRRELKYGKSKYSKNIYFNK